MPAITTTRLPGSEVKIEITVEPGEYAAYLEEGAKTLSQQRPLPGFRPGHVPLSEAQRAYGEMAVLEAALERIIRAFYVKALLSENIAAIGSPSINMEKLVPGQPLQFHAVTPVEPAVKKLADFKDCQVQQAAKPVHDEQINEVIEQMRKVRRTETLIDRAAGKDDLLTVDLEMKKDGVIVEGGTGRDYKVYLNEQANYLPSFAEQLIGMKAGEEKTIEITFPADHYQKHLAGQPVTVDIKAKSVHEMALPAVDDAFAQGVGLESADALKAKLRENLTLEAEQIEMLEKLVNGSEIEDAPEILVNDEVRRIMAELRHGIEEQGGKWEEYLTTIKKTADDLRLELVPQAIKRIKTAVLVKHVAKENKIDVASEEVDAEIDRLLGTLRPDDKAMREQVTSADYREYVHATFRNRKTIEWLKQQCIKKSA